MKPSGLHDHKEPRRSLPVRERGLKQTVQQVILVPFGVAPRAGAWIETLQERALLEGCSVAPRAGAWIETDYVTRAGDTFESLPVRERGLKLRNEKRPDPDYLVAPRAGAWIETFGRHPTEYLL